MYTATQLRVATNIAIAKKTLKSKKEIFDKMLVLAQDGLSEIVLSKNNISKEESELLKEEGFKIEDIWEEVESGPYGRNTFVGYKVKW